MKGKKGEGRNGERISRGIYFPLENPKTDEGMYEMCILIVK